MVKLLGLLQRIGSASGLPREVGMPREDLLPRDIGMPRGRRVALGRGSQDEGRD